MEYDTNPNHTTKPINATHGVGGVGGAWGGRRPPGRQGAPRLPRDYSSRRAPRGPPAPAAMGAAVFFGCAGIAFGPALALVLLTVAAEPLRVIVLVAG